MYEKQIIKILKAVNLLARPYGCTIKELQDNLGISRRSVYRLLDTLQELNFPIYDERFAFDRTKKWKLEESYLTKLPNIDLPRISFTLQELILIQYMITRLSVIQQTSYAKLIKSISDKISAFTSSDILNILNIDKEESIFVDSSKLMKSYEGKEEIIQVLIESILARKRCLVVYDSFSTGEVKNFYIDPLKIFEYQGGLYLFVNVPRFNDIRMLAIERIKKINLTDQEFEIPEGFDAEEILKEAFHITFDEDIEAKIWFSSNQAKYIKERQWFKEQKILENKDGSIVLQLKTNGLNDLKRWVLSYGCNAKVLEPEFLKNQIIEEVKSVYKMYTSADIA